MAAIIPPQPGRHIEVHLTDSDRRVQFTLDDDQADAADDQVADAIVRALHASDPDDAERQLASGLCDYGTVRCGS